MLYRKISLSETDPDVFLEVCVADKIEKLKRKAILVIPGGGYRQICSSREGEPIGQAFMPYGFNYFVLHYSVDRKKKFPAQLIEASLAVKHIKDNAEEYGIDKDEVYAVGFSAGGHLCASLGVMWDKKEIYDAIDMPFGYNKPCGIIPVYPVISANVEQENGCFVESLNKKVQETFLNLLCNDEPTEEELQSVSLENFVSEKSSPAFLVHTTTDQIVSVKNSLRFAEAYAEKNLKFELHIYPKAPHGCALSNKITSNGWAEWEDSSIAKWVENAVYWIEHLD